MTKFDKIMRQIKTVPNVSKILNIIYPPICGICGKINKNSLCKKCEIELKKQAENRITNNGEEIQDKYFNELMYIFKYEGQIRQLIIDYKFNEKSYIYKTFVNFLLKNKKIFENIKKYDTIVPVPISKKRYKERGYNQSYLIAKEISKNTKLELQNRCIIKSKNVIEQSKLNKEEREKNIKGVYEIIDKENLQNKRIILVDDIYTTGNTVNECCRILQKAQPKSISVIVIAKD